MLDIFDTLPTIMLAADSPGHGVGTGNTVMPPAKRMTKRQRALAMRDRLLRKI